MSQFTVTSSVKKKEYGFVIAIGFMVTGLAILIMEIIFLQHAGGRLSFNWLLGICLLVSGLVRLRPQPKKDLFVSVAAEQIQWQVQIEQPRPVALKWQEIHWIKQEAFEIISFYQQSSFSETLSLQAFTQEQGLAIKQEIESMASQHNIRLVNF